MNSLSAITWLYIPLMMTTAQLGYMQHMEEDLESWMNFPDGYRACLLSARQKVAAYLNAPSVDDVVFVDNASTAINALLRNWPSPWKEGDVLMVFLL